MPGPFRMTAPRPSHWAGPRLLSIFGVALAISALLKSHEIDPFAAYLSVRQLAPEASLAVAAVWVGAEWVISVSILAGLWRSPAVPLITLVLSSVFFVVRFVNGGEEDCGCFGSWLVPDWVAISVTLCGLVGGALVVSRPTSNARAKSPWLVFAATLGVAGGTIGWVQPRFRALTRPSGAHPTWAPTGLTSGRSAGRARVGRLHATSACRCA